jgi:hypothetical protein
MAFTAGADHIDAAAVLRCDPPPTIDNRTEPADDGHQRERATDGPEQTSDDQTSPDIHASLFDPLAPSEGAPRRRGDAVTRLLRSPFRFRHAISPESHNGFPQLRNGAVIGSITSATSVKRRRRMLAVARKKAKKRNSVPIRMLSSPEAIRPKYETTADSSRTTTFIGENSTAAARPEKTMPLGVESSTKTPSSGRLCLRDRTVVVLM